MSRSLLTSLLLGSLCATGFAQNESPNLPFPIGDQINAEDDAVPAPADGNPDPNNGNNGVGPKIVREGIQELNMNGDDLAAKYRLYTDKRVLVSAAAAAAEFRIYQPGPLTYTEAASILTKQALMEGFIFVPSGPNEVKLVLAGGQGASPKGEGLPVVLSEDELPVGDTLVNYVMNLNYIKPDEAIRTFQTIGGTANPESSYAPVPNASSIVITEKTNLIRKLIEIKDTIDVPSAQVSSRWVTLKHADVESVAEILNEIFSGQQNNSNSAAVQRNTNRNPAAPPIPGGAGNNFAGNQGGGAPSGGGEETPPQIIPDTRTNRIFILGRPVDLSFIESLIKDFDIPDDQRNFLRRKLKYLTVVDFLPIAEDALARVEPTADGQGGGASANRGSRSGSTGGASGGRSQRGNNGAGGASGAGGGNRGGNSLSDPNIDTAPESIVVGKTLLVADNISNSIVVQGPPQSVEIINKLIDELDVQSDQVMISAVFGQLDRNNDLEWSTNIARVASEGGNTSFAGGRGSGILDVEGLLQGDVGTISQGIGLSFFGRVENWNAFISALQQDQRFTTLSRPTVFTTNNRRAVLSSGQRIAVPTSTFTNTANTGGNNNNFSTNIEFRDIVLSLEVIPLVNSSNEITMEIALLNDNVNGQTEIGGLTIPNISTDEINTYVTVNNGGTVALGGLITKSTGYSKGGIPLLKDIPVLGNFFSTNVQRDNVRELIVFIQPRIVSGPNSLQASQVDLANRMGVSKDTYEFAHGPQPPVQQIQENVQVNDKGQIQNTRIRSLSNRPAFRKGARR